MAKDKNNPWSPAEYDLADAGAIQALIRGDASPEQQQRAVKWIIESAAGTYDQTYWPGGEEGRRNTDFAEGKRFVGNSIVKLSKLNLSSLRGKGNEVS
jgi:hypothetical protein